MSNEWNNQIEIIVGKNVRAAREALGWKQDELAGRAGSVSRSTIAKIESFNATNVSMTTLSVVADALGIPPYMLLLGKQDWQKLANIATTYQQVESYHASNPLGVSPDHVEKIEEMSSSGSKKERQRAVKETNAVVAKIFGLEICGESQTMERQEQSRTAGTGMATSMIPHYPIINGLIANLITA